MRRAPCRDGLKNGVAVLAGILKRYMPLVTGALIIVVLDQLTKSMVREHVELYRIIPVTGFFNITHIQNPGAAFGFMSGVSVKWIGAFFIALTLLASAVLIYLYHEAEKEGLALRLALTLILGGALGNLIDRVTIGTVTDFLDFYIGGFHWWAFNIADSCITIGAIAVSFFTAGRSAAES